MWHVTTRVKERTLRGVILSVSLLCLLLILVGCGGKGEAGKSPGMEVTKDQVGKKILVAQSMPTLNNPWYVLFAKGSKDMANELGVDIIQVTNPETQAWSPAAQIAQIENLIAKKPDVLEIDPTSTDGIVPAIEEAKRAGIPVVVSGIHVATKVNASVTADNKQGGRLCGEYLAKLLNGSGKVAMILGTPGRDIIRNREDGFREAIRQYPGIKIVAEQIADLERAKAVSVAENILQAHPDLDAIWAANDEMALGALEAVRAHGKAGKIIIGGFDATPDAMEAIRKGEMHFSANQIPYEIGVRAVAVAVMVAQGKAPPAEDIVLPMSLVTTENVNELLEKEAELQRATIHRVKAEYGL